MSRLISDGFGSSTSSGALAGAAAGSVCWEFLWQPTDAGKVAVIEWFRIHALMITPFTAAQEWGFDAVVARGFGVAGNYTAGTAFTPAGAGGFAKNSLGAAPSQVFEIRMAAAAALIAPGAPPTQDATPFISDFNWELVAGVTVARTRLDTGVNMDQDGSSPLILQNNEGILVRPTQALGAGGVVRLSVDILWREVSAGILMSTTEKRYQ